MSHELFPDSPLLGATAWGTLAEHTSDFVGLINAEGVALFMNRSVRGAPLEQVVGKRLEEFLGADRAAQIRAMLEETKRTGLPGVNESLQVVALDGTERWFVEKCIPVRVAGEPLFMLVRTETTHQRRTESALRASEERYRVLFESNPDPVLVYCPSSLEFLAANAAAERLYGWSREELVGKSWLDLHPPDERDAARRRVDELLSPRPPEQRSVVTQVRRDGQRLRAEIVDNPIQYRGGSARICVVRDVTEREQLEAQLRHAQKMEAIGVLAGGVAHDFNNLLSVIASFASAARDALPPGGEYVEDLGHVLDAARRGSELTKQLLVFSKRQLLTLERVDLAEIVVGFAGMLQRLVGRDIVLEVVQAHAPLPLVADRTQLEQVILNLVMNARQAMPKGGVVTITASRLEADAGFVAESPWARPGTFAELRVTDRGCGMDRETAEHAFEPFFTTKAEGTGLGLAVVHGIVQQHAGLISMQTAPGEGTTFRVLFPLALGAADVPAARLEAAAPCGGERLLVAEDEAQLRDITERGLSRLGFSVVAARDGEDALDQFERAPQDFDLVVLDVVMPKLGGPEAWARMRARRPDLKALFVTGYAPEQAGLSELVGQPGLGLLRKPFTTGELAERVRQMLRE